MEKVSEILTFWFVIIFCTLQNYTNLQSAVQLPLFSVVYSAITLRLNSLYPELVKNVLDESVRQVSENLAEGKYTHARRLIQFLAYLNPIISGDGLYPLLERIFTANFEYVILKFSSVLF